MSLIFIYLAICCLMVFSETWLVYRPLSAADGDWDSVDLQHEDVWFESSDGTRIFGWFLPHPSPKMTILYCHGNAGNLAYHAVYAAQIREELGASVFIFDYRGYGRSEGKPFEKGIVEDGLAAQRWLAERMGIESKDIVVWGRSLGGGVAVAVAAQQDARALVLENTFSSAVDVAAGKYIWLPVRFLMRNRYDCVASIGNYKGPVIQSHGALDRIVPIKYGRRLFDAIPSTQKRFLELPDTGHNHQPSDDYYSEIRDFLAETFAGKKAG
jgi:hypothetical protein